MRAAGWSLWNYAVNGAMETRNAEELRHALEDERQPNPVTSTHPYALHGRVESGDVVREEPLDGYGLARAERDFRARPDGVAYTVRGTHGGPRTYSNVGGSWEQTFSGPREDWQRSFPPKPVYAPYYAPGEEARLDALSAREEARMGRLMRGRLENPHGPLPGDASPKGTARLPAFRREEGWTVRTLSAHSAIPMIGPKDWSQGYKISLYLLVSPHGKVAHNARKLGDLIGDSEAVIAENRWY